MYFSPCTRVLGDERRDQYNRHTDRTRFVIVELKNSSLKKKITHDSAYYPVDDSDVEGRVNANRRTAITMPGTLQPGARAVL